MTEALLFASTGSLLTVSVATLIIAVFTLRTARRYVELAEESMANLREGQALLLLLLREGRQSPKEEREKRLEAQRRAEPASRELLLQAQRRSAEGLGRHRTRRDIEQRIDELKRELQEVQQESSSPLAGEKTSRPASSAWETARKSAGAPPQDKRPRLAVWHPHPDDDVSPGRTSAGQSGLPSDASVEMFRRHYDKYLENYEGYVKLAERIYRMRDNAGVPPGSSAEREWEERLRRVTDGIRRTTARLDILEEYNPELATDDRISRRAAIARSHSELERSKQGRRGP